ncbi:hypothetical protein BY996DRAFT_6416349 [Phakopsora pachyrhizi]|uniref:Expressed protein n=1 Tax=Phakopsora pachyrhizi TaxID=170000 RepID=A0AAV0B0N3_PHAPC|nr:hypothetical protein BY996DRAFT_6416349 [Phakopsora pachyrhizi]CAH7674859.1 expressed protein [Phakopsora pachyrhizi]
MLMKLNILTVLLTFLLFHLNSSSFAPFLRAKDAHDILGQRSDFAIFKLKTPSLKDTMGTKNQMLWSELARNELNAKTGLSKEFPSLNPKLKAQPQNLFKSREIDLSETLGKLELKDIHSIEDWAPHLGLDHLNDQKIFLKDQVTTTFYRAYKALDEKEENVKNLELKLDFFRSSLERSRNYYLDLIVSKIKQLGTKSSKEYLKSLESLPQGTQDSTRKEWLRIVDEAARLATKKPLWQRIPGFFAGDLISKLHSKVLPRIQNFFKTSPVPKQRILNIYQQIRKTLSKTFSKFTKQKIKSYLKRVRNIFKTKNFNSENILRFFEERYIKSLRKEPGWEKKAVPEALEKIRSRLKSGESESVRASPHDKVALELGKVLDAGMSLSDRESRLVVEIAKRNGKKLLYWDKKFENRIMDLSVQERARAKLLVAEHDLKTSEDYYFSTFKINAAQVLKILADKGSRGFTWSKEDIRLIENLWNISPDRVREEDLDPVLVGELQRRLHKDYLDKVLPRARVMIETSDPNEIQENVKALYNKILRHPMPNDQHQPRPMLPASDGFYKPELVFTDQEIVLIQDLSDSYYQLSRPLYNNGWPRRIDVIADIQNSYTFNDQLRATKVLKAISNSKGLTDRQKALMNLQASKNLQVTEDEMKKADDFLKSLGSLPARTRASLVSDIIDENLIQEFSLDENEVRQLATKTRTGEKLPVTKNDARVTAEINHLAKIFDRIIISMSDKEKAFIHNQKTFNANGVQLLTFKIPNPPGGIAIEDRFRLVMYSMMHWSPTVEDRALQRLERMKELSIKLSGTQESLFKKLQEKNILLISRQEWQSINTLAFEDIIAQSLKIQSSVEQLTSKLIEGAKIETLDISELKILNNLKQEELSNIKNLVRTSDKDFVAINRNGGSPYMESRVSKINEILHAAYGRQRLDLTTEDIESAYKFGKESVDRYAELVSELELEAEVAPLLNDDFIKVGKIHFKEEPPKW